MARPLRVQYAGAYYHVYNRGINQQELFFDDWDRLTFLRILGNTVSKFDLQVFAYCLMENHFHLFVQTTDANLGESMQMLQSQYAQYVNAKYSRIGSLYQGRYKDKLVEKDSYSLTLIRYIHRNPLDSKTVLVLEDYPWSSYSSYVGKGRKWDWLNTDWMLIQFHKNDKEKALNQFKFHHLQKGSEGSDPCGPWIKRLERLRKIRCSNS